jgi:pimeloyl-ACP methyl ester carboxylesterase
MGKVADFQDPQHIDISLWHELYASVDYLKMKASPIYYGWGAQRGDRSAVVVVPGFMGCDAYLVEMYFWLWRIGYKPYFSHIGHNAECPDILTRRLLRTVNKAYRDTGRKVHLVGHSLGGVLSRGAASLSPHRVASVITLGSPFRGVRVNPTVLNAVMRVRQRVYHRLHRGEDCYTSRCVCGFTCAMREDFPDNILQTAIYTKDDGVVDWHASLTGDEDIDIEVQGTHVGLVWNSSVYEAISLRLHEAALAQQIQETRPMAGRRSPLATAAPESRRGASVPTGHKAKRNGQATATRRRPRANPAT